ncbi:MAG: GNAT family N-acetyltransferase [Candidatus Asgardarchaeum sp.]
MIIRQAKEEELEEILNLYYESSKEILGIDDIQEMIEYDRRMYGEQYKFLSLENLKKWFQGNSHKLLVAEVDGQIAGFIIFHHIEKRNIGYIEEIHVKKEHRGKGVGSTLLLEAEKRLYDANIKFIFLEAQEKSVPFFLSKEYIPLYHERTLYMGILDYVDMVKFPDVNLSSLIGAALEYFKYSEEASSVLKKVIQKIEENNLQSIYASIAYLITFAEEEDNRTQSYIPLYKKIKKETCRILGKESKYKNLLEAIGLRILAYGDIDLGNYRRAIDKLERAKVKLEEVYNMMKKDIVWNTYPYSIIRDFVRCYLYYVERMKRFCEAYVQYAETGNIIEDVNRASDKILCEEFSNQDTEIDFFEKSIEWILNFLRVKAPRIPPNKVKLDGTVWFLNFFTIENYEEKFPAAPKINDLRKIFTEILGKRVVFTENLIISEDIIPELQKKHLTTHVSLMIPNPILYCRVMDKRFYEIAASSAIEIVIFGNGTGIVRFSLNFEDLTPLELYHLTFITNSSILEYDVKLGDFYVSLKDFEEAENWNSLWYAIKSILDKFSEKIGTGKVLMESEPISYVVVNIQDSNVHDISVLKDFPELFSIVDRVQTVMSGPSIYFRRYLTNKDAFSKNLAPLIGFDDAEIYASKTGLLLQTTTMPQWIVDEIMEISTLLTYQRFYLYIIRLMLDKFLTFSREGTSIRLSAENVNKLRTEVITKLWILSSPLPLRYSEYLKFIETLKESMGINNFEAMIKEQLSALSRVIEIEQISALHDLQYRSEEERKILDYIATIVGILGVGEILWRIISVIFPEFPEYTIVIIYAILSIIGLVILRRSSEVSKESESTSL